MTSKPFEGGFLTRNRTPDYEKAVAALRKLEPDLRGRAYAEASCQSHYDGWVSSHGVKLTERKNWRGLIGKSGKSDKPELPGDDHTSMWLKDGNPEIWVSQPYGLSFGELQEIVAECEQLGLRVDIDARPAWHFPGRVLQVEWRAADRPSAAGRL